MTASPAISVEVVASTGEVWRPVPGWPEYEVSESGAVRRLNAGHGARAGRILKPWRNKQTGYLQVSLWRRNQDHRTTVHRLTFRLAALDGMRTTQLLRIQGGGGDLLSERQAVARRRLAAALDLFGGADSAGGSCLWHVLGLECSLREWAMRQGWSGRPVHHVQAQGILLTALGVLAAHYGLQPRERAA